MLYQGGKAISVKPLLNSALAVWLMLQTTSSAQTAGPVLSVETNRPESSTFALGEAVQLSIAVAGVAPRSHHHVAITIRDATGALLATQPVALVADDTGKAAATFNPPAREMGYYEVGARLDDGTTIAPLGTRPAGIASYAIVPDPRQRVDYGPKLSRFGLQGGFSPKALVEPYLGVRYYLYGHDWAHLEAQRPGQFAHDPARAGPVARPFADPPSLAALSWNGTPWNMYPLAQVTSAGLPAWAIQPGTTGKICKGFGGLNDAGARSLGAFARAEASAFAASNPQTSPRIYQITWEPAAGWCFGGSPQDLVNIYALSVDEIRKADPDALIAGPTLFIDRASSTQLDALLAAGLGKYIDILSVHPYVQSAPPEKADFIPILRHQMQAVTQAAGHPVGLIGTEHGFTSTGVGNLAKAQYDIRTTLMMLGEGARFDFGFYVADFWSGHAIDSAQTYGFYWNLNPKIAFGTDKLGPKIAAPAYAGMTWLLDGSVSEGPMAGLSGTQLGYRFRRGGREIAVAWDYAGSSRLAVPSGARVCDWMANCSSRPAPATIPIDGTPVYFITG